MTFTFACKSSALKPGKMDCFTINGKEILVANVGGEFFAMDNTCTHEKAPLSEGSLNKTEVTCPLHAACYDIRTGKVVRDVWGGPPAGQAKDEKTYATKVQGEDVLVDA